MRVKNAVLTALVAASSGVLVAVVGAAVASEGGEDVSSTPAWPADTTNVELRPGDYATNDSGQTLGSYKLGTAPPDLIEAESDQGKPGYVYFDDMFPAVPANPEEAAKDASERVNEDGEIVLTVYAADGRTKIGTFVSAVVEG